MSRGRVLITGASGFIGYEMGLRFMSQGYDVVGWDLKENQREFNAISINMSYIEDLEQGLSSIQPDIIIHCAGSADVGKSVLYPNADYEGNVTLTHNLMFAIHKLGLEKTRVVFLSSAGVYGNPSNLPITEDTPLNPLSPYALHKAMCEEICQYFVRNYGSNVKIARIFSAYGAGLRKQIFWDMNKKLKETGKLNMFGTGYESRDYIHVNDVVQALFLIAVSETNDTVFNVANGEEVTIRQATEIFAQKASVDTNLITFNGVVREGDPINWKAEISKIQKLGYKKSVDMEKGIADYLQWIATINNEM